MRRHCEVCDAEADTAGPWCELYCSEKKDLCWFLAHKWLDEADARGDGPLVNALCELGRKKWGECLHW